MAVWPGSVQQVFNYDLSHIYTNSPWCCLSILSFSSKSNSFNLVSLLIVAPVLINFYLCNKHSGRPGLKFIWSKKWQLLRLNYYYFKNCNNLKKKSQKLTPTFPIFFLLAINIFYPVGLTNSHMLSSLKGSSSSLKINMSLPGCGNGCLQQQVYIS